jgi:DNA-directed RNA polymerase subunit RPC12/RpoP
MDAKIKGLEKFASRDGYVRDELTPGDVVSDIYTLLDKIRVDIVEQQDHMIMHAIREIGGTTYERITIDREKVLKAFEKSVKKNPIATDQWDTTVYKCPTCGRLLTIAKSDGDPFFTANYCSDCGQALDWDGLKDRARMGDAEVSDES